MSEYVSGVIGALRGQGAPAAAAANPGITLRPNARNTVMPTAMPPATGAPATGQIDYSTSKYFDPNDPFAAGAALNQQYGAPFKQDTDAALPDMRQFGGRYAGELASTGGRRRLGRDLNLRDANTGATGIYRQGDFDMLPGMGFDDEWTQKNYANMFQNGNSMFIPDKVEVDPGYWYRSPHGEGMNKQDQEKNWSESYYGGRLLNSDPTGANPEGTLRNLMNRQERLTQQQTPDSQRLLGQIYAESRAPLIGMDVGRGGLSYEQGDALNRAIEYRGYLDKLGPASAANQRARDMYQSQLDNYMQQVNTIQNPDGLSSAELIRALRGG